MLEISLNLKKPANPTVQIVAILKIFKLEPGVAYLSIICLIISAVMGVFLVTGLLLLLLADSTIFRQRSFSSGLFSGKSV